ncbi:MAG: tetratricopeptide repeat protein [Saprospiraceae bacterium]|nr:tetratricopeptide repeat protein [Saprospiraceae bacterium]
MKKAIPFFILFLLSWNLYAQPNCEIYKADEKCYNACQEAMRAIRYEQGSYQSQAHFDKSIELCPTFAYSYMEKAVPYLKRGLFVEWKALIDKAVELEPKEYLGYRGWCRLQFLRDYEGAINDIEKLKTLVNYDIGYCQTGDYHLSIALALCYKELGDMDKARELMLEQLSSKKFSAGLYDYYHIGVLEYEAGNHEKALTYLDKQLEANDYLGETYYFKALAHKQLNQPEQYLQNLKTAETYYRSGKIRTDPYAEMIDKIYLNDILEEMEKATSKE